MIEFAEEDAMTVDVIKFYLEKCRAGEAPTEYIAVWEQKLRDVKKIHQGKVSNGWEMDSDNLSENAISQDYEDWVNKNEHV